MDKKLINTHDKFFKTLFSRKNEIREFVSKAIRPEIVEKLDLNSLRLDKTEYIDYRLRSSFSDLVYNCKYGSSGEVKISLLFEHKSQPEEFPHIQLLGYILRILDMQIKQNQGLTTVIPIVFYHGKKKWQNRPFETYFISLDNDLKKFIPSFEYELIDLSTYSNKELADRFESIELQIGLLLMKNIFNEYEIIHKLNVIFANLDKLIQTDQGKQFFETITIYMLNSTTIDTNKYREIMRNISQQAEQQFVSTAMKLEYKGVEKGIEKGIRIIAIKLIIKGYDNQSIADITSLSQNEIEQLRKEAKKDSDLYN